MHVLRWMLLGLSVLAAFAAARASLVFGDYFAQGGRPENRGIQLAQWLPFERNRVEPIDPKGAFVEGYHSYQHRDLIATIGRMRYAASQLPQLADYALFYLALAERDNGDDQAAAGDFGRLTVSYPQSVWREQAGLEYARLELKEGHPNYALTAATAVVNTTKDGTLEQNARLTMAYALLGMNSWRGAYNQSQIIRERFPTGPADPAARRLAHTILQSHPEAISVPPIEYHRTEAALLLREGQSELALNQIRAAMALLPPRSVQAELTWLAAEASRLDRDAMKRQLLLYLELAPRGPLAGKALNALAHLYWHENDTRMARLYFQRLPREFPHDELAPKAMFEIGRTYEEDGDLEAARRAYLDLIGRYPSTGAADDARFRATFMLFMLARYQQAAAEFGELGSRASNASSRDMFAYWQARSWENSDNKLQARGLFQTLALSTASNYYPALAATRVNQPTALLPAAFVADLAPTIVPSATGPVQFHLTRVAALRDIGLRDLEPPELRAIENYLDGNSALQKFVLAEFEAANAWYDAIQMAMRVEARGELEPSTAERIRYPRGFWDWVRSAAGRNGLDPYLVAALIRQESLFDPQARSTSDARGLMQLLPGTADRYAAAAGIEAAPIDLYDPHTSIQLGTAYLHQLMTMFGGNIFKVVAAYNAGEKSVSQWNARYPGDDDEWVENIGFRETREYVKKVIGGMREYQLLYGSPSSLSSSTPTR
ncbi:MAG: transglycosylase SLT domain-containing protein [Deltaproteobacteria bacterium]|nr:transglycosylase SLT domain-containing protein [Deltaproteobacteria bacterium]